MNYPLDSIVIVAPILFLVLMVSFPIIGIFGGWKRALYWGGGNLIFYVIGLLIWMFCHASMDNLMVGLLKKLLGQESAEANFAKIASSVLAPIFFVVVTLSANLLLLINYYAWFKRVAGLKKYKKVKKEDKDGNVTKVKVKVNQTYSTKYKVMNKLVGGFAMPALMLPTIFALTNAVFFTTTSYKTRSKSSFASKFYNALVGVDGAISWGSYYSNVNESARDYDALFAALDMKRDSITIVLPGDEDATEESLIDALSDTLDKGLGGIYSETALSGDGMEKVIASVNDMIRAWNQIVNQAQPAMTALFNSPNGTLVVCQLIVGNKVLDEDDQMTHQRLEDRYTGSDAVFPKVVAKYMQPDREAFPEEAIRIPVTQGSFNNMVDALVNLYKFKDGECQEGDKEAFWGCMSQLLTMLFKVK